MPSRFQHFAAPSCGQAVGLGDLARAGAVVARRAVDQQDARRRGRVLLARLRRPAAASRVCLPLDRQVVVGIGEAGAGLVRHRRLVRGLVVFPGGLLDCRHRAGNVLEGRVHERAREHEMEFIAAQLGGRLPFSCGGHRGLLVYRKQVCEKGRADDVRWLTHSNKKKGGPSRARSALSVRRKRRCGLFRSRWRRRRCCRSAGRTVQPHDPVLGQVAPPSLP